MNRRCCFSFLFAVLVCSTTGCPKTSSPPSQSSLYQKWPASFRLSPRELERRVQRQVNKERRRNGLAPLRWDVRLRQVAYQHSLSMARNNYFSHTNERGESPMQRGFRVGLRCSRTTPSGLRRKGIGENLFQNHLYSAIIYRETRAGRTRRYRWSHAREIIATTVRGWMESPTHRQNILSRLYTHGGVGVAISLDGKVYITHNFC
ncbi:MAG: CAP domain-containing protein [Deltaproteobacteria bacterium]|nr:MAG: CAP domain-containing protein [Deltaproteobacteria bacterium]